MGYELHSLTDIVGQRMHLRAVVKRDALQPDTEPRK